MHNRFTLLAMMALFLGAGSCKAGIIVYTDSVTASGFLGNDFFSNSLVTVISFADTADVKMGNGFYHFISPMTVTIASLNTTATVITDFVGVYVYTSPFPILNNKYVLSFADDSQSGTILETQSYEFANYDLKTPLGPITGISRINPAFRLPTDHGGLILTAAAGDSTFIAIPLQTTLEPASVILAGFGLAILFLLYPAIQRRREEHGGCRIVAGGQGQLSIEAPSG